MADREPVRLVIWDLDETFWRGTLTEGGITEYVTAHHDLVIELAHRGIMSSICSKNEFAEVKAILVEQELWDYFIFPSIDWSPKPGRIAKIIEAVQLRAPTVLFIDDNPSNRAAAAEHVPGLQVESEAFIPQIANHQLFRGKDDKALTRLAQYKLMETRKADQIAAGGDDDAFLRESKIRVTIEPDILPNIDRAVELVNRTNQLNFTKNRLPDDPEAAASALAKDVQFYGAQSGLIRVADKYGDYGYCGFYLIKWRRLVHFCFSCRILGFGVEQWLYHQLKTPRIEVVGEVLTDLRARRKIDWINADANEEVIPTAVGGAWQMGGIKVRGACEGGILEHYFLFDTKEIEFERNDEQNHMIFRGDSLWNLQIRADANVDAVTDELARLGFQKDKVISQFFEKKVAEKQALILFCGADFRMNTYRHKRLGFRANFYVQDYGADICSSSDADLLQHIAKFAETEAVQRDILAKCAIIREDYEAIPEDSEEVATQSAIALRQALSRAPVDWPLFIVTPHTIARNKAGLFENHKALRFINVVDAVAPDFPHVGVLSMGKFVCDDIDITDEVHYARIVYFRLYSEIKRQLAERHERALAKPASKRPRPRRIRRGAKSEPELTSVASD